MATTFAPRPEPTTPGVYSFPTPDVTTLDNGLRIEHFETNDRLITFALVTAGGSSAEPRGREGAATLAAELRREGTAEHSGEELSTALDIIGASFGSSVNGGATVTSVRVPQSGAAAALQLLVEMVTTPTYPVEEFERLRGEMVQEARSELLDPGQRAELELRAAMFDADDRASRPRNGSVDSLLALSREDVMAYDAAELSPERATLVIGGRLEQSVLQMAEESGLTGWTGNAVAASSAVPAVGPGTPRIVIIDRPEAVQTEIRLGVVTPAGTAAEFPALRVASQVLGGAMNSRLSAVMREEKGYTYGVGSYVQRLPGRSRFVVSTPVDADASSEAIDDLVSIVNTFRVDGPTADETDRAREEMLQGAALRFQTASAIVRERAEQVSLGLPLGWLDGDRAGLSAATPESAAAAFAELVPEGALAAVFVGDARRVRPMAEKIWGADRVEVRSQ